MIPDGGINLILEPVQPSIASGIIAKFGNKGKFMGPVGIFHDTVESNIKGIAKDQLVNTYSRHYNKSMTGSVG